MSLQPMVLLLTPYCFFLPSQLRLGAKSLHFYTQSLFTAFSLFFFFFSIKRDSQPRETLLQVGKPIKQGRVISPQAKLVSRKNKMRMAALSPIVFFLWCSSKYDLQNTWLKYRSQSLTPKVLPQNFWSCLNNSLGVLKSFRTLLFTQNHQENLF